MLAYPRWGPHKKEPRRSGPSLFHQSGSSCSGGAVARRKSRQKGQAPKRRLTTQQLSVRFRKSGACGLERCDEDSRNFAARLGLTPKRCCSRFLVSRRNPLMKIAQISPLVESVPPRLYGGTERVVSYLTEELVAQGHDVTLFASGDSLTEANFVPCCRSARRLEAEAHDPIPYHMIMLDKLLRVADQFDILHFHIDHLHFPLIVALENRAVTTLHGRQDLPAK